MIWVLGPFGVVYRIRVFYVSDELPKFICASLPCEKGSQRFQSDNLVWRIRGKVIRKTTLFCRSSSAPPYVSLYVIGHGLGPRMQTYRLNREGTDKR